MAAGRSALREYRRRRTRARARVLLRIPVAVVVGVAVWEAARVAVPPMAAPLGAGAFAFLVVRARSREDYTTWAAGAEGEQRTAGELGRLPRGFEVLHDRRVPGTSANIDHLVVGPTGVFCVETKRMRGRARVRRGSLRVDGAKRNGPIEQALWQAEAVEEAVGVPAQPVLCIRDAHFRRRPRMASGVWVVRPARLRRLLRRGRAVLDPIDVHRLAARAGARLPPAG